MSQQNANKYPAWIISVNQQILSVAADGTTTPQSPEEFAFDIAIADDGTLWVVSTTADPDGGGAKIYWGLGDGKWNEINTPDPGAVDITGTGPGHCLYTTQSGDLWTLDTTGKARSEKFASNVVEADYGSTGVLWAVFPDKPGEAAVLHYGFYGESPFTWRLFPGNVSPTSISANNNGNCYGLINGVAIQYSQAGTTMKIDQGAKRGMSLSFKQGNVSGQDLFYLTTAAGNQYGNPVMKWNGNQWIDAGFRAIKTLATYYTH